jgi:hypothetical protein
MLNTSNRTRRDILSSVPAAVGAAALDAMGVGEARGGHALVEVR